MLGLNAKAIPGSQNRTTRNTDKEGQMKCGIEISDVTRIFKD
jgi:hypothetical protein